MNKKFTFMVAALLAAGGFSANAQITTNDVEKVADDAALVSGNQYYIVLDTDGSIGAGDVFLGVKYKDDAKKEIAASESQTTAQATAKAGNEELLWKVVVNKGVGSGNEAKRYYSFINVKTGAYLAYNTSSGDLISKIEEANDDETANRSVLFSFASAGTAYDGQGQTLIIDGGSTNVELDIEDIASLKTSSSGSAKIRIYKQKSETLTGTDQAHVNENLNKHLGGGGFSLDFPLADGEPALQNNVFAQPMKAFYFNGSKLNSSDAYAVPAGTYFATKYPADGKIESLSEFNASTFVVVDPVENYDFANTTTKGLGQKLTTKQGLYIKASASVAKGEVPANNANFTVTEEDPINKPGELKLTLSQVDVKDGEIFVGVGGLGIGVTRSEGSNYLTTVASASAKTAKFAVSTVATPADLLKADAPAVYTIQFTSGKDEVSTVGSEYDKYLYSSSTGSAWKLVAEGTKYVDIKNPVAQWTISDYDKTNNTFTFRNRLTAQTIVMSLNKLGDGEYQVLSAGTTSFNYGTITDGNYDATTSSKELVGTTVKLTASAIDKTAGFATIEDKVLSDFASLKFDTPAGAAVSAELFLNVAEGNSPRTVKALADASKATKFSVVKFDGATSESDVAVTDTVYVVNGYKYWDADKKEVKSKISGDTLAYVTYAFKQVTNDGKNWYLHHDGAVKTVTESYNTPKFILKENLNGTYALLPTYVRTDATEQVFAASSVNGAIVTTEKLYGPSTNARDFSIVFDETNPSLKAESKHVAFNTSLGYVAMNENAEGIVAPVSSLKAEYSKEDLTFWLDTADSKAVTPSFLISKAGKFMYNATDSAYYYDSESATEQVNKDFLLADGETVKAMFQAATLKDSETITVNEKDYTAEDGLNNFKFQIVQNTEDSEGEYVIRSLRDYKYLTNSNGKLGFTEVKANALVVSVETMEAPTSNESVSASEVAVVAQNGSVVVKNAAGKNVVVSTILGQVVANEVLTSDNATINVPAGIVVVAVEGESFKINVR